MKQNTATNKRDYFTFKSTRKAKNYCIANKRKHRNKTPFFKLNDRKKSYGYTQWFFIKRCETHNFNANKFLTALRMVLKQRLTIRRERIEALEVLSLLLLTYCDFSPASEYLFEVRATLGRLAKMGNFSYIYYDKIEDKVRERYDSLLGALEMLEQAELITICRQYDKEERKHKPMRIWLNPEFLLMFGVTEQQLRKMLVDFHKYQYVKNQLDQTFAEYQKHLEMLENYGIADLSKNYSLRNLLKKKRKDLLGEHIIKFVSQRKPANYLSFEVETNVFKPCFRSFDDCTSPEELNKLRERLLNKERIRERARLKAQNDSLYRQLKAIIQ